MEEKCTSNCNLFDFMAKEIGITVLHPGGYEATDKLTSLCRLTPSSYVLDLACGTGSTSFYLSKKYHCQITGVDISPDLIDIARNNLGPNQDNITFEVADALCLPYPDNSFDAVISQAFFVLIDDKEAALKEIFRVLKPGGYLGALEKSWFTQPTDAVYQDLIQNTCSTFIPRVQQFDNWERFFASTQLIPIKVLKFPMASGFLKLLKSEGILNFSKIMYKMMKNRPMRSRMMTVQKTFSKYNDYLGYGIYCFQKKQAR